MKRKFYPRMMMYPIRMTIRLRERWLPGPLYLATAEGLLRFVLEMSFVSRTTTTFFPRYSFTSRTQLPGRFVAVTLLSTSGCYWPGFNSLFWTLLRS
jgi:hypothetical protein